MDRRLVACGRIVFRCGHTLGVGRNFDELPEMLLSPEAVENALIYGVR